MILYEIYYYCNMNIVWCDVKCRLACLHGMLTVAVPSLLMLEGGIVEQGKDWSMSTLWYVQRLHVWCDVAVIRTELNETVVSLYWSSLRK